MPCNRSSFESDKRSSRGATTEEYHAVVWLCHREEYLPGFCQAASGSSRKSTKTRAFGHTTGVGATSRGMLDNGLERLGGHFRREFAPIEVDGGRFYFWIGPNTVEGKDIVASNAINEL